MSRREVHLDRLGMLLFVIPVYRVSPQQWWEERQCEIARYVSLDAPDDRRARWYRLFEDRYGDYAYNQVMGWLHVVRAGSEGHVKCYYFRVSAKRVGRHFRQAGFREVGKIADFRMGCEDSSAEIMASIRDMLVCKTQERGSLRGRYLDFEVFDNLASALDIKTLLGLRGGSGASAPRS